MRVFGAISNVKSILSVGGYDNRPEKGEGNGGKGRWVERLADVTTSRIFLRISFA